MQEIANATHLIDVRHEGRPSIIAAAVLTLADGVAIVDPGPASTVPALTEGLAASGIGVPDIRAVLLTHIHLDHAGATGTLVRENPRVTVLVHERGAKHIIDPTKLLNSAQRLYGDDMERLWGRVEPVPEANLRVLSEHDDLTIGDRPIESVYTPGHASHHVSYLDERTGTAFVGDAAGIRINQSRIVLPATAPPEIDVDTIERSFDRIAAWNPARLMLTHFGTVEDIAEHGAQMKNRLREWAAHVRRSLDEPGTDEERAARFSESVGSGLRDEVDEDLARTYEKGGPLDLSWYGLARYWRKRLGD